MAMAVGLLILNGCDNDPCDDVVCMNGGNCISGTCECPEGWIGDFCETQLPQKLLITKIRVDDFPLTRQNGDSWALSWGESNTLPNVYVSVNEGDVITNAAHRTVVQFDAIPADGPFNFDNDNSSDMPFTVMNVQNKKVGIALWHFYETSYEQEQIMGEYTVDIIDSYPDTSIRFYDPNSAHQVDITIEVEWEF